MIVGSQITLTLYDSNRQYPIAIDFDSFDYKLIMKKTEAFRTIGKTEDMNNVAFGGFNITLTRIKEDNLLDLFLIKLLNLSKQNSSFHELLVTKKVKNNYSVEQVDIDKYYSQDLKNEKIGEYSATSRKAKFLANQSNFLNEGNLNFGKSAIENQVNQIGTKVFGDNFQKGKDLLSNIYNTVAPLKGFMDIDNIYKDPFREMYVYHGCSLIDFSGFDKPQELSEQTITLQCTGVRDFSDGNQFNDWLDQVLLTNSVKNVQKDIIDYKKDMKENKVETKLFEVENYNINLIKNLG